MQESDTHSLAILNNLANLPDVLPNIAPGHEHVDLAEFFTRPGNLMVGDERGVVCFINLGEAMYGAHWLFAPGYRGKYAIRVIREAFSALFTYREAVAITGLIPREHRASNVMAHALGCRRIGVSQDSHGRSCNSYIMERVRWATLSGA
jgi:Protein of unknown function (DUF2824)